MSEKQAKPNGQHANARHPSFADAEDLGVPPPPAETEDKNTASKAPPPGKPGEEPDEDKEDEKPLVSAYEVVRVDLPKLWERNDPSTTTGLKQLDHLLAGGLRPGNVLA
jgi:hypothetical protein